MAREEITAALVQEAEQMLAQGMPHTTIAANLGLTPYVVAVIANDHHRRDGPPPPQRKVSRRIPNTQPGIDASTIRRIQRMLEVGILPQVEIAREAGVSPNTVMFVACGKRKAVTVARPHLDVDERFLPEPVRCGQCGARISVAPCRACRIRDKVCASRRPARAQAASSYPAAD